MKAHMTLFVVAGAVVLGLAILLVTAYPLESAQTRLERRIDEKVDLAQRMLLDHRPIASHLDKRLGPAATQPVDVPADQWQRAVDRTQQEGPGSDQLRGRAGEVQTANDRAGRLEGESLGALPQVPSGIEAYQGLQADLQRNSRLLDDALQIVQSAIAMSEGEFTGADHPAATRLEAVLCYHRADQFRRDAAFYHTEASDAQARFARDVTLWHRLATEIGWVDRELHGAPAAATAPASGAASTAASAPAASAPSATDAPVAPDQEAPALTTRPAIDLPPIGERIARLEARKTEVAAAIEAARGQEARLTTALAQVEQQLAAAAKQSAEAEKQMLALQEKGADPSDPEALRRFEEAYAHASAAHRAAFREMSILQHGAARNAHVDTTDSDEVLTGPLSPVSADRPITTERGLTALQSDLRAARAVIETQQVVAAEIDRQIAELTTRRQELARRAATLQAAQAEITQHLARTAGAAIAAMTEATRIEEAGLTLVQERGKQAAQRARHAIEKRIADARDRNAENPPQSPNPRLVLMATQAFGPAHAIALQGDFELLAAQIHAARVESLRHHAMMLGQMAQIGMAADAGLLPAGATPQTVPAAAIQAEAARTGAEASRRAALEAAQLALQAYEQADSPLQQLWVLHANMASVHHLMANLTTGDAARKHADDARLEYLRAVKGRDERPETPRILRAVASLATQPGR